MISCIRTDSANEDFIKLVRELDSELSLRDGADHSFYAQYNKIDKIKNAVVAYENNIPVGCGAFKLYSDDTVELKRMFVPLNMRRKGIASIILAELENWAKKLGYTKCILETGLKQPEAIAAYTKSGYMRIPNFGQYEDIIGSVCFEKIFL